MGFGMKATPAKKDTPTKKAAAPAQKFDNTNRGVLFVNDKEGNEKRPDYTGTYTDGDGNEFKVSAWIKTPKNGGEDFLSFVTQPKGE